MSTIKTTRSAHHWTAAELRQLPSQERDAILAAAAIDAEVDYRGDSALTDFEALGDQDLYGDRSNPAAR